MPHFIVLPFFVAVCCVGPVLPTALGSPAVELTTDSSQGAVSPESDIAWPTTAVILKEFAPPDPDWLPGHRGLDLQRSLDGQVRTPRDGTISWVGSAGSVPIVVITHGVTRATYQPIKTELPQGTRVEKGQIIGQIDQGGHCKDQCLHWGLKLGERYFDPRLLLQRQHAVLVNHFDD